MKIALVAPPLLPIPPVRYGGVERVVGVLAKGLLERGHEVTLFAPGDSRFAGELVPTVARGVWNDGFAPDPSSYFQRTIELVLERAADFDVIHSHIDHHGFELGERSPVPFVGTIHGRTDLDPLAGAIRRHNRLAIVAISASQRAFVPEANWVATVHHGLDFSATPAGSGRGGYLVFVGRLSPDKGVDDAVEVARQSGRRLLIAAKALDPTERRIHDDIVMPAVASGVVDFLGELDEVERDRIVGAAFATVMLSRWPEPFGLVAIESLATGTPLIARRSGALPEIVEDGLDGFVVDGVEDAVAAVARVASLDRARIRARALERFSATPMLENYERVYAEIAARR